MDPRDVKAYLARGWAAAEALKEKHWAQEFARRGSEATLEASRALWEHMRLLRPDWPSDEERREDLSHHLDLKGSIDRAAGAFIALAAR